ncbi:MAG TPA: hypothetical protein VGK19_26025 [Capsulimonadaceae bacterium]|jgi:xylan 1,4-beta-xylosidase
MAFCCSRVLAVPDPAFVLVEGENGAGVTAAASDGAVGGKVATAIGGYQEVGGYDVPLGASTWTVWVRYRGSALQLKSVDAAGKRTELNWSWAKPTKLTWVSFGPHPASELGSKIALMRGPADGSPCEVDEVLFARDAAFDPVKQFPDQSSAPTLNATGVLLAEAEDTPGVQVDVDTNASGGKVATGTKAYQVLLTADVPRGADSVVVWVRYRSAPMQLKTALASGEVKELNWQWEQPAGFKWVSFGRHAVGSLGKSVSIMCGPPSSPTCAVDALVFAKDDAFNPDAAYPALKNSSPATKAAAGIVRDGPVVAKASDTSPINATVSIDWRRNAGTVTAMLYGSNDMQLGDPKPETFASTGRALDRAGVSLLRIHSGGLTGAWSDSTTRDWNREKIAAAYSAAYLKGRTIIQNIPKWPSWMKTLDDGTLDKSEYGPFAEFCAKLVRIVNIDLHAGVQYWEPQNEWELNYDKRGKLNELWTIYNLCAVAMKRVDPGIQVGGIAFAWDDPAKMQAFVKTCGPNVDFVTYHRYGSGDAADSTDTLMGRAREFGERFKTYPKMVKEAGGGRQIPIFVDEFSVNYTWDSGETRQWSNVGAVWFASTLRSLAYAGATHAMTWAFKDWIYGVVDMHDNARPVADVLRWGNMWLTGQLVGASSTHVRVEAMAVRHVDGSRAILLINKATGSATVTLKYGLPRAGMPIEIEMLDGTGTSHRVAPLSEFTAPVLMPPYSLLLLLIPA